MTPSEEQIDVAVEWWQSALADPSSDNGEPLQSALMSLAQEEQDDLTEEQIECFGEQLRELLSGTEMEYGRVSLKVDYHPGEILSEAREVCGISPEMTRWPTKTYMHLKVTGAVEVSEGYRAEWETIREPDDPAEVSDE